MSDQCFSRELPTRSVVGIDIGGANLKYVSLSQGKAVSSKSKSRVFQLWKRADELAHELSEDLRDFGRIDSLAVTMTGELADCFLDRAVGVEHIVKHAEDAAALLDVNDICFYRVDGRFCDARSAIDDPDSVAAANWHAMASWAAREIAPNGLLVDIGSTTADIIPLVDGAVATQAKTDFQRLKEHSLVYVGGRRTPVCALVDSLTFRGESVAVMNEWFATIDDARILLGLEEEAVDDFDSADGKPRTIAMAANRIARTIGLDHRGVTLDEAKELSIQITHAARQRINAAVSQLWDRQSAVILSGHASDLVDLTACTKVISVRDLFGSELSRCCPAYAVAKLRMSANDDSPESGAS